jgi:hypothetical protein
MVDLQVNKVISQDTGCHLPIMALEEQQAFDGWPGQLGGRSPYGALKVQCKNGPLVQASVTDGIYEVFVLSCLSVIHQSTIRSISNRCKNIIGRRLAIHDEVFELYGVISRTVSAGLPCIITGWLSSKQSSRPAWSVEYIQPYNVIFKCHFQVNRPGLRMNGKE